MEVLEAALETATGTAITLRGAGRTDAGVHAVGQAIAFRSETALPPDALRHICLQILPPSVRVSCVEEAPPGWNPQRDAVRKLYRYRVLESARPSPALEHIAWRVGLALDIDAMRDASRALIGQHDFRAFRNDPGRARRDEGTVRTIESITLERRLDLLHIDVVGPGFLYMMVRNVSAALMEVGRGHRDSAWVAELLASRDRRLGPAPAPAHGLTLENVEYADGFGQVAESDAVRSCWKVPRRR